MLRSTVATWGAGASLLVLVAGLAGCGSESSTSSTGAPGMCGTANAPPGCIEISREGLPQTSLAYPQHVLQVYRDGRVVDVYTDLADGQTSLASDICRVVSIDVSPDGIPPDIENPLVEVWSANDTMIATGPNEETLSCSPL